MAEASVEESIALNILHATMLAMQRAVAGLAVRAESALVDGNRCPRLDIPVEAVVRVTAKIASIAAASILAKTVRDAGMLALHTQYPQYGFDRHMGYRRPLISALQEHGASPRASTQLCAGGGPTVAAMKLIQSRDKRLFKQLRKLAESGRERRKAGQTLLDGVHLVEAYEKSLPCSIPWSLPNRPSPVVK